jgi:hypothetical protein
VGVLASQTLAPELSGTRARLRIWFRRAAQLIAGQSVVQALALGTGLLLVRWMTKQQYAEYTLAASGLAMLNVITDLGLSSAVLGIGGQWRGDSISLAGLIHSALHYRRRLLYGIAPALFIALPWIFARHGWPLSTAIVLALLVFVASWLQAGAVIYGTILKLEFAIAPLQFIDAIGGAIRLGAVLLLGMGRITALNAVVINLLGSAWQFAGNRARASAHLGRGVRSGPREQQAIWDFTRPLVAANLFYAAQGQLTIWLTGIFAPVTAIAEVGALGRLGQVTLLMNTSVALLVQPYLARLPIKGPYRIRLLQITMLQGAAAVALVLSGLCWPQLWLRILGSHYQALEHEVMLAIVLAGTVFLGDCFYFSLIARSRTSYQWLRIPATLGGILLGAILSPPATTMTAIAFQFFVVIPYVVLQACLLGRYLLQS